MKARAFLRAGAVAALALLVASGCDPLYLIEPREEEIGTVHEGTITTDETWRTKDNPHKVVGRLVVAGPGAPTLTLERGVKVLFARGAGLYIAPDSLPGSFHAVGTSDDRIELMSEVQYQSHGYWGALHVGPRSGAVRLEHVTIRDCGGTADWPEACLRVFGSSDGRPHPVVRDVLIAFSSGYGVVALGSTGFGQDSRNLGIVSVRDLLVRIDADRTHTLPSLGQIWGEREPAIQVAGGAILQSRSWLDTGLPYVVTGSIEVGGTDAPVLELPAGVELQFGRNGELRVGVDQPGGLLAEGTADRPVVFTTPDRSPRGWRGLTFGTRALSGSRVSHAVVEYGGYPTGYSVANISFLADVGPILRNSAIRHSSGCGVARLGSGAAWVTDFTDPSLGNRFDDNAFGPQCTAR